MTPKSNQYRPLATRQTGEDARGCLSRRDPCCRARTTDKIGSAARVPFLAVSEAFRTADRTQDPAQTAHKGFPA